MVGIAEHYLGAQLGEFGLGDCFYAGLRRDREEGRGVKGVTANGEAARTGAARVGLLDGELEQGHDRGWR